MSYFNVKTAFLTHHLETQLGVLHRTLTESVCKIERKLLRLQLALARIVPHLVGMFALNQKGLFGLPSGEAMYIYKCNPVEVKLKRMADCYEELPVLTLSNNVTMFMSPITHILVRIGNIVPCRVTSPTLWHLENQWVSIGPDIRVHAAPDNISPDKPVQWNLTSLLSLSDMGIYTQEQIEKSSSDLLYATSRQNSMMEDAYNQGKGFSKKSLSMLTEPIIDHTGYGLPSMGDWFSTNLHIITIVLYVMGILKVSFWLYNNYLIMISHKIPRGHRYSVWMEYIFAEARMHNKYKIPEAGIDSVEKRLIDNKQHGSGSACICSIGSLLE
jgi:hypothetical protein